MTPNSALGLSPSSQAPVVPSSFSTGQGIQPPDPSSGPSCSSLFPSLVDVLHPRQGDNIPGAPKNHHHFRRQPLQMGSSPQPTGGTRLLDSSGPSAQHQLFGAAGDSSCPVPLSSTSTGSTHPRTDRQHHGEGPRQPPGRHSVKTPDAGSSPPREMGRGQPPITEGRSYCQLFQHVGRLPKQDHNRQF